ncbi:MAG: hypothetical protein WDN25_10320 [Acetobacteraceae bacterium]
MIMPPIAATRRVVDEGINAVPERIAGVQHVGAREHHADVAVGVRRLIAGKHHIHAVHPHRATAVQHVRRDRGRWRGGKIVVPVLDALRRGQVPPGIGVRNDRGAERVDPGIAVGVVEVPVRVDQPRDRIGAEFRQRALDIAPRRGDAGIHQQLAIGARQHGDVAARALQHADRAAQLRGGDLRRRRRRMHALHDPPGLGVRAARRQSARRGSPRTGEAAQAEAAPRQWIPMAIDHARDTPRTHFRGVPIAPPRRPPLARAPRRLADRAIAPAMPPPPIAHVV